jgi:ABC-type nitrate/sulfonate/bicarbonate transport system substrate-binding protein
MTETQSDNASKIGSKLMNLSRLVVTTAVLVAASAANAETIRVGLPTKTFWPTTVAETAVRQKLFEKEGLTAELTIYRSGAETFEGMAAGAADIILDPPSLVSAGRKKGVMSKIVAGATMGNYGWQLMVPAKSTLGVKDLNGKKVAITAAGSGSDLLALWTIQDRKIDFTRVPVGGGGLVPNLLAGNVDAAVVYSPLSFQILKSGEARTILDYATAVPPNLTAGWIVLDKFAEAKPQVVQKALNALYGAVQFMRDNRDVTVKLIADLYEMPPEIAALEYENTILKLETSGDMAAPKVHDAVQLSLDLAKLGGLKDIVPTEEVYSTSFKPAPTKP